MPDSLLTSTCDSSLTDAGIRIDKGRFSIRAILRGASVSPRPDLGERVVCHNCNAKYYTLNREDAACPKCDTQPIREEIDPIQAAMAGISDLPRPKQEPDPSPAEPAESAESSEDEDGDDDSEGFSGDLGELSDVPVEEED